MSFEGESMDSKTGTALSSLTDFSEDFERIDLRQPADYKSSDEPLPNVVGDTLDKNFKEKTDRSPSLRTKTSIFELCEELELFGVSRLLDIKSVDEYNLDAVLKKVMNATHDMIFLHRQGLREQDELEAKLKRIMDDNRALKSTNNNLKGDVSERKIFIMKLEEELRQAKEKTKKTLADLKVQNDEVRQLKNQLKYVEKQNSHELRRKEQELMKLQSQLSHSLGLRPTNKNRNSIVKDVKSKQETNGKEDKDMYQQIICKFEAANKGLLQENLSMNCALQKLNKDLASLATHYSKLLNQGESTSGDSDHEKEDDDTAQIPSSASWEDSLISANKHIKTLSTIADSLRHRFT